MEHYTPHAENFCERCGDDKGKNWHFCDDCLVRMLGYALVDAVTQARKQKRNQASRVRYGIMRDLGMVRARNGSWE